MTYDELMDDRNKIMRERNDLISEVNLLTQKNFELSHKWDLEWKKYLEAQAAWIAAHHPDPTIPDFITVFSWLLKSYKEKNS